jgi:hypothetical protein
MLVLTLVVTVPLIFLDGTQITGVRAWVKPTKFAISGAIYAFTFLWILSLIQGHRRLVNIVSWITAGTFMLEMVIIVVQVLRGTTSHFNFSTALDGTLFGIMGAAITMFWSMGFIAAVLLIRQRMDNKALAAGIRAGLGWADRGIDRDGSGIPDGQGHARADRSKPRRAVDRHHRGAHGRSRRWGAGTPAA